MRIAYLDHRSQDVVPGLLSRHDAIREHASVPANMREAFRQIAIFIAQPIAGVMRNIELSVWVVDLTMTSGLVMRAHPFDRRVVLRDVEIDRPRPQGVGQFP